MDTSQTARSNNKKRMPAPISIQTASSRRLIPGGIFLSADYLHALGSPTARFFHRSRLAVVDRPQHADTRMKQWPSTLSCHDQRFDRGLPVRQLLF